MVSLRGHWFQKLAHSVSVRFFFFPLPEARYVFLVRSSYFSPDDGFFKTSTQLVKWL